MANHKMNTLIVLDVVVKLIDNNYRRMTMLTSYDSKRKPKALGSDMLDFTLAAYANKEEYKGDNVYEKVLGKAFTSYVTERVNELLIQGGLQGKYTELTVLAIKEIDHLNDMIISDNPFEVPNKAKDNEEKPVETEDK